MPSTIQLCLTVILNAKKMYLKIDLICYSTTKLFDSAFETQRNLAVLRILVSIA